MPNLLRPQKHLISLCTAPYLREINVELSEVCGVPYGRDDVLSVFIEAWCEVMDSKNTDGFLRNGLHPKGN